ncbi:MAG TPA: gamma-glutamyltransferase [Gaiellaceae bacterium]|nr:gamma-glutamyltransferase [Gaiellaceae bacterium]
MIAPAVAAGHPATADAGAEILAEGGSAADAAVAACLASCVAETVMTGLLGGGHAIYFDVASGATRNLDCFVSVPSGSGAPMESLEVPFGEELVHYAIGASSCAVPGVPAGLDALWRAHGRLPWARLVEPALRLAREGVIMPAAHVACLAMLAPVMTMREGGTLYAPAGELLAEGDVLRQPGLVTALELVRDEGAASVYSGTIAHVLLDLVRERGGAITPTDLEGYAPVWAEPATVEFAGRRVLTRRGLSGVPETLARFDPAGGPSALLAALDTVPTMDGHTTNLTVVDTEGNACVLTTSLGLGSGDWLPGLDLHLNSMLGESDLITAPLRPGDRMASMMAPTLAFAGSDLDLALGAAGGTRLRTALVGVLGAVLHEGVEPQAAIDRPRFHPAGNLVNAEPGVDEAWLSEVEQQGRPVRRWSRRHHYFGGVSALGRLGAGADPRRGGAVRPG